MAKVDTDKPHPRVSVVMAAYNAAGTISGTLDNLLSQTYKDLEITVVNDGSTDNTAQIVEAYAAKYPHIHHIPLEHNVGPFRARVIGANQSTGEFLHFLDADDYLSIDFYRVMVNTAILNNSDMVIGDIVIDDRKSGQKHFFTLVNDLPFSSLTGSDVFDMFMQQSGFNFTYQINTTKLYRMSLWHKTNKYYDWIETHLIMADDVAMHVPIWFFAKRLDRAPNAIQFYVKDDNDSATSNYRMSYKKMAKNITDLHTSFGFFERFLKHKKVFDKYKLQFTNWKKTFVRGYYNNITNSRLHSTEQDALLSELYKLASYDKDETWLDTPFFEIAAPWNSHLEELKLLVADPRIKTVQFDIFNTLIVQVPSPLPDTHLPHLRARKTGHELYDLALHLDKTVVFTASSTISHNQITTALKSAGYDKWDELYVNDTRRKLKSSSTTLLLDSALLPSPIEMFRKYNLDESVFGKLSNLSEYRQDERSIMHILANHIFDNPHISFLKDSTFNGSPSIIGYYSLGLHLLSVYQRQNSQSGAFTPEALYRMEVQLPRDITALRQLFLRSQFKDPYEMYVLSALRMGARECIDDVSSLFNQDEIRALASIGVYTERSLAAIVNNYSVDLQVLRPLVYRYGDVLAFIDANNQRRLPSVNTQLHHLLGNKNKLTKLLAYSLLDRGEMIGKIKKKVDHSTAKHPALNKAIRNTYDRIRALKRSIRSGS